MAGRTTPGSRYIISIRVRSPDQPPMVWRMYAVRHQTHRVTVEAGENRLVILDKQLLGVSGNVCVLVLNSSIEGLRWWKVASATPAVDTTPMLPKRYLRPFEITDDPEWNSAILPAVVVSNPTQYDSKVTIFFAVAE